MESGLNARQEMRDALRPLQVSSPLQELHPGWILEKLEGESSAVIGVLCRFLSGDKVKYLLRHLPPHQSARLPKIKESYDILPDIAEIVRFHFERRWRCTQKLPEGSSFSFSHLMIVKEEDLKKIFRDLGLEEIRKAFSQVEPQTLKTFLVRFTSAEAREIRDRIEGKAPAALPAPMIDEKTRCDSQRHIVSLPLGCFTSEELFLEIGYSVFARSLSAKDLPWATWLCQKLSPEQGHRLKRMIDENSPATQDVLQKKQDLLLQRIQALAKSGQIRRYWKER